MAFQVINQAIIKTMREFDYDIHDLLVFTNYQDVLYVKLLKMLMSDNIKVTDDQLLLLKTSLQSFLDHVQDNGGTYEIGSSGTYTLKAKPHELLEMYDEYESFCHDN